MPDLVVIDDAGCNKLLTAVLTCLVAVEQNEYFVQKLSLYVDVKLKMFCSIR